MKQGIKKTRWMAVVWLLMGLACGCTTVDDESSDGGVGPYNDSGNVLTIAGDYDGNWYVSANQTNASASLHIGDHAIDAVLPLVESDLLKSLKMSDESPNHSTLALKERGYSSSLLVFEVDNRSYWCLLSARSEGDTSAARPVLMYYRFADDGQLGYVLNTKMLTLELRLESIELRDPDTHELIGSEKRNDVLTFRGTPVGN